VIKPREALRYYQILVSEHVAGYPDCPADAKFKVTLEQLLAWRDADRAAAAAAGGPANGAIAQPEDGEETAEEAAEAAIATYQYISLSIRLPPSIYPSVSVYLCLYL
jgi:hypothetical protein